MPHRINVIVGVTTAVTAEADLAVSARLLLFRGSGIQPEQRSDIGGLTAVKRVLILDTA